MEEQTINRGTAEETPQKEEFSPDDARGDLPYSVFLELTVKDSDTIAELVRFSEGEQREQFAQHALRIGVLALRQARGQVDAQQIRHEGERLLENLESRLDQYSSSVHDRLTIVLKEYFDPQNGRFQERVQRLIQKDGELEDLLKRQIGSGDSELRKTLTSHVGDESRLMKILDPDQSKGLLFSLKETFDRQLDQQRDRVLKEFTLDNKESALSRFISELTDRQNAVAGQLNDKIDEVVKEFSLDEDESALNRLVRNVDRAQRTITNEFSLDEEGSALCRLKKLLENTNEAIHSQLSLDDETSALARVRRELFSVLKEQGETNQKFQEEVKSTLESMKARREEAERSTRHGIEFEQELFEYMQRESQKIGDVAKHTGNTTGLIKNCKVGDCIIEMGPDSAAPGARIVVEAKEKAGYVLAEATNEIEQARKNRDAQIGVFVFSKKTAPEGLEPLARYGNDVVLVWDAEDEYSMIYLRVGMTLARALCVRSFGEQAEQEIDFQAMDRSILEIEKRSASLGDVEKWTETIRNNSDKILQKISTSRRSLEKEVGSLKEQIDEIKTHHTNL